MEPLLIFHYSCHYQKIRGIRLVINLRGILLLSVMIELWFHQATELDVEVEPLRPQSDQEFAQFAVVLPVYIHKGKLSRKQKLIL